MTNRSELRSAILRQDVKTIERLLDQGADVDDTNCNGITSLHVASFKNYAAIVQILISHGASINQASYIRTEGYTALQFAIKNGHREIVKILLRNNAEIHTYSRVPINTGLRTVVCNELPLCTAVKWKRVDIARDLLKHKASVESHGPKHEQYLHGPLFRAIDDGSDELVKLLIDSGANINKCTYDFCFYSDPKVDTPLHRAIIKGRIVITKMLLEHGACINVNEEHEFYSALYTAIEKAYELGIHWKYVEPREELSKISDTELNYTEHRTAVETIVNLLLDHGAVLDPKKESFCMGLHGFVKMGNTTIVERILKCFPDTIDSLRSVKNSHCTLLHSAVDSWNVKSVEFLIRHGANVNAEDDDGHTPIFYVIKHKDEIMKRYVESPGDDLKTAELLLRNGANLDLRAKNEKTLFRHAINYGDYKMLHFFLMYKACVKSHIETVISYRHVDPNEEQVEFVEILSNNGAPINSVCFHACVPPLEPSSRIYDWYEKYNFNIPSSTPLDCAVSIGHEEFVKLLLSKGADAISVNDLTLLYSAIRMGHDQIVKLLLDHGFYVDVNNKELWEAMFTAVLHEDVPTIEHILKSCPNVSEYSSVNDLTLLYSAIRMGHDQIVKLLLDHGFYVDVNNEELWEAMFTAVLHEDVPTIEHILKSCPNGSAIVNKEVRTLLQEAVVHPHKKVAKLLIKYYDMNAEDKDGHTVLWHAIDCAIRLKTYERFDMVKYLIEHGARLDSTTHNLVEMVDDAIMQDCYMLIELLLKYCPDVKMLLHSNDHSFLQKAFRSKRVTRVLMKYGASVNATDESGETALHHAIFTDHNTVEMLIKYGSDVNRRDKNGNTALHLATSQEACSFLEGTEEDTQVVQVLLKYGADINIANHSDRTVLNNALEECSYNNKTQIIKHIIKMKAANLFVSQHNLKLLDTCKDDYKYNFYKTECEKMRKTKVADTNLCFYDVLTGIHYARNETVVRTLESHDYEAEYPLYSDWIKNNFEKAQKRVCLLNRSAPFFNSLLGHALPEIVTMKICNYLSNFDLQNLNEAYTIPEKLYEIHQRNKRKNNVIIKGFTVRSRHNVEKEVKEFLETIAGEEVKLESVRELQDEGDTYLVRFADFASKILIMKEKRRLQNNVFINNDLTERQKEIQKLLRDRAQIKKTVGYKVGVGYMKLWLNDREFVWDEDNDSLVERKTGLRESSFLGGRNIRVSGNTLI